MILDPEKKYHRWQIGHLVERIEPAPDGKGYYKIHRIWIHHRFIIAGINRTAVDVDNQLLEHARDPEALFRREAKFHAQALRYEARRIRRRKIAAWFTWHPRGVCTECGCTDDHACEGGCTWVDERHTLCSRCSDQRKEQP
jgi:hypothetical protein